MAGLPGWLPAAEEEHGDSWMLTLSLETSTPLVLNMVAMHPSVMIPWESRSLLSVFSKPMKQKIKTVPEDLLTKGPEWVACLPARGNHQGLRTKELAPEEKGGALRLWAVHGNVGPLGFLCKRPSLKQRALGARYR